MKSSSDKRANLRSHLEHAHSKCMFLRSGVVEAYDAPPGPYTLIPLAHFAAAIFRDADGIRVDACRRRTCWITQHGPSGKTKTGWVIFEVALAYYQHLGNELTVRHLLKWKAQHIARA
jgi:hypothetical protein